MEKRRLNLTDILIILLILAVIAAGVYLLAGRNTTSGGSSSPQVTVEYKVQFVERDQAVADMFVAAEKNGEKVWVGAKERTEADFTDVLVEPAQRKTFSTTDEKYVLSEIPGYHDVTVTLRSSATETDDNILLSGNPIHVGDEVVVRGKGFAGYGFVIDMNIVK